MSLRTSLVLQQNFTSAAGLASRWTHSRVCSPPSQPHSQPVTKLPRSSERRPLVSSSLGGPQTRLTSKTTRSVPRQRVRSLWRREALKHFGTRENWCFGTIRESSTWHQFMASAASSSDSSLPSASAAAALVIWLHGLGDTGAGWSDIQYQFSGPGFEHIQWSFPTAPNQPVSCNGGFSMPAWFDMPEIPVTAESENDEPSVMQAVKSIHRMIDSHVAAGVSPSRILIGGFSQGGAMAVNSALLYPHTLAGAVVFSGWLALGGGEEFLSNITQEGRKTPVLWCHGTADQVVYFEAGKAGPPVLASARVNCEFKAYPGMGHSACPEELDVLKTFIKQRLEPTSSVAAP